MTLGLTRLNNTLLFEKSWTAEASLKDIKDIGIILSVICSTVQILFMLYYINELFCEKMFSKGEILCLENDFIICV